MPSKFETFKDKSGKHRFRLKAANGETVLASQGYATRQGVMNGIKSVQVNSKKSESFKTNATRNKKFRFNLMAVNGRVIGTSETYNTTKACANGIQAVRRAADKAKVVGA